MNRLFEAIKSHDLEKVALIDADQSYTYGELFSEINARADALFGIRTFAIAIDNSADWVLWDLAATKSDVPCVPLPPFFTNEQISHSLQSAGVSHILSPKGLRNTAAGMISPLPEGTSKVTFTSGTTGSPKGVCLPRSAMYDVAQSIVGMLGDEFVGTHVSVLPLAVLLENVAGVYAGLMAGCRIKLTSLQEFGEHYAKLHTVLKYARATSVILVPEILRILMAQVAQKGALPNLKFIAVGGSKIDAALIAQAHAMGLPVYEGYGLSECASVVSLNTPRHHKPGSVGKILPHVKAKIVNGEIEIKDPGFLGYIGEKAPETFATGDLGALDEDGFLSVTGRKKNVLITSYGRNVSPEWVESVLLTQSEIAQVVVYGDAEPHLSAIIVPSRADADIHKALKAANAMLPEYAHVKNFKLSSPFTVEDGSLTGTGRPRRENILNLTYLKENKNELLRSTG